MDIDWAVVKRAFNSYWSPFRPVRFEKSPPHIVRARQLEMVFENSFFLVTIRNPYAQVEGMLRRGWTQSPRSGTEFWISCADVQVRNIEQLKRNLFFTYEELTEETDTVIQRILSFLPELISLNPVREFNVHNVLGKPIYGLMNLNQMKIENLTDREKQEISTVLRSRQDLLLVFGYSLM